MQHFVFKKVCPLQFSGEAYLRHRVIVFKKLPKPETIKQKWNLTFQHIPERNSGEALGGERPQWQSQKASELRGPPRC